MLGVTKPPGTAGKCVHLVAPEEDRFTAKLQSQKHLKDL